MTTGTAAWRLEHVHHIGITVVDIERSLAFYRDLLGMTLIRRRPLVNADYVARQTGYPGVQLRVASLQTHDGGPSIELAQYLNHQGTPLNAATNQPGSSHLCLVVSDLNACHTELKAKGVAFKSEPDSITAGPNKQGLVVYLSDPDGYTIELFQPPRVTDPAS